jgi:hypothetical protein
VAASTSPRAAAASRSATTPTAVCGVVDPHIGLVRGDEPAMEGDLRGGKGDERRRRVF